MALLLIVWLGGQALQNLFDTQEEISNEVVARAFGEEVKTKDLARMRSQKDIGESLIRFWNVPWIGLIAQMAGEINSWPRC